MLLVDAANVVGSVPDGWWRDRAAAAARLHAGLLVGALPYEQVILVLEGAAVAGVPAGVDTSGARTVTTVHAVGHGDDEIVAQCLRLSEAGHPVALATADRGLLARVEGYGVTVVGPQTVRLMSR